jgi:hypothetical protein
LCPRRKSALTEFKDIQAELERELRTLMERLGISGLKVLWSPDETSKVSGEVKGKMIYIFEPSPEKAREILRHEALDYLVSSAIEPYKEVTNALIKLLNQKAYERKEAVVEKLSRSLSELLGDAKRNKLCETAPHSGTAKGV